MNGEIERLVHTKWIYIKYRKDKHHIIQNITRTNTNTRNDKYYDKFKYQHNKKFLGVYTNENLEWSTNLT